MAEQSEEDEVFIQNSIRNGTEASIIMASNSTIAGLLAASDHVNSMESLDCIDVDFNEKQTTKKQNDSLKYTTQDDFDLPQMQPLPTLESILLEKDSDAFTFNEFDSMVFDDSKSNDGIVSIASEALPLPPEIVINNLLKPKKPNVHGSILRHVILKKISSQMIDACNRRDAGLPTSMAVSNLIAIGTSHGLVLVFEPMHQVLKLVLGTTADGNKYGAVTALGINVDCNRLLCGYARGQVTMWDLTNGNCLRVITEAHPAGYAVLHIQFTDDPTVAMLNDSSGSVYTLSFKRLITRTCESSCFFSGTKGEVCTMVPLHVSPNLKDSPLYHSSLLAMASLTKLIIVNMNPKPNAIFTQKLTGPQECLPLIGWHFAVIESESHEKQIVPVLAFARNETILFYHVLKVGEEFRFNLYQTIKLHYTLVAMNWLNSQIIVTIDTFERIRTIDVQSSIELECLDIGSVQLVYGSSYFKSLSTGGNVSKALKAASEHACYQSFQIFNGQLLLLGTKSIHCLNVRDWKERLDFFLKRNEFIEALQLAKLFYEDKAKAVVGLTGSRSSRKNQISEEIINILLCYLDVSMAVNCPKTNDESILGPYFQSLVPVSIEYCLLIGDLDVLFTDVYDRFVDDDVAKKEFLESLETYILDDKLTYLSPVLMQDLIEHYEVTVQLHKLEACLVHLDLSSVDIDYMVKLCWAHRLFDLIIYIFNKGLHDYLTPLERLIKMLRDAIDKSNGNLNDTDSALGCKILVYLSCCLAGNQYPIGLIDEKYVREVKDDIFNMIIIKKSEHSSYDETYPYVRTLLLFDTREFLNVLSLAFEEKEFQPANEAIAVGQPSKRQKVVDVLLLVMVNDSSFSPAQIGCLFTFIARQMAKHEGSIQVNQLLFEQVLEYLTNPDEERRHEEREQALLELLAAGGLHHFPDERVLALAEAAKFYRVCEIIYQKKRQYEKVLSCYWRDSARRTQAFTYIDEMLADDSFTDLEKGDISAAVLKSMDQLVEINSMKYAQLIINQFPAAFNEVAGKLQYQPEIQYTFLKGVFDMKLSSKRDMKKKKIEIEPEIQEQFIELMCRFEPEDVYRYLQANGTYRLEQALAIVQSKKLVHATSYLLERMGDVQSAFKLLCDDFQLKVDALNKIYLELDVKVEMSEELEYGLKACNKALQFVMHLCQRNSQRLESEDREALWFPLLETVMAPQRRIKDTHSNHFLVFKEFTKDILINMMAFISLPAVLQKIMQDPTYSSGKFGEIKELILGMLDTYNYELTLLETTTNLLGKDLHGQYYQEKRYLSQGYQPSHNRCCLCSRSFMLESASSTNDMILFRCGHAYHHPCLQGSVGFDEELMCVQCNKTNAIHTVGNRRHSSRTEIMKMPLKKGKGGKKLETRKVDLSTQQEEALNGLWNHNNSVSKMAILSDLNGENFDWASHSSSWALNNAVPQSLLHTGDMLVCFVVAATILFSCQGFPITQGGRFAKNELHLKGTKNTKGQARDFMNEVIGSSLRGHRGHPDSWMDFYHNGATWDHYMSPQLHHETHAHIQDPHYDVNLSFQDHHVPNERAAAYEENHAEAYPGEIVSGENSLSKFIAPPVFDEPTKAMGRDTIDEKYPLNTPNSEATEAQNTRKLVDSLNSFMTPLKEPTSGIDNTKSTEQSVWSETGKKLNSLFETESNSSPGPSDNQDLADFIQGGGEQDGPLHESPKSRENLGRMNDFGHSFSQDPPEKLNEREENDFHHDRSYDDDDDDRNNEEHFADHHHDEDNNDPERGDSYKQNEHSIETFRESNEDRHDYNEADFHSRHDKDNRGNYKHFEDSDNRDNFHNQDNFNNRDNFDNRDNLENRGSEQSAEESNEPYQTHENPKPIEGVQDDSGRIKPLQDQPKLQQQLGELKKKSSVTKQHI